MKPANGIPAAQTSESSTNDMEQDHDHPVQNEAAGTLAHVQEDYKQHRIHADEIHKMKVKILEEKLVAQKSFWEEKEKLLEKESRARIEAMDEVKSAEINSIRALQDIKIRGRREVSELILELLSESYDLRNQLSKKDYEACDHRNRELHELKKLNLRESDDESDEDDNKEEEEEQDEDESFRDERGRKRQRRDA